MKSCKILFTIAIMVTTAGAAFSQQGFEIGVRYEVQKSMLFNKTDKNAGAGLNAENTMSYLNGGLALGYNFTRKIGIEVDILRSRQGQSYTTNNLQGSSMADYRWQIMQQSSINSENAGEITQAKAELNGVKIPVLVKLSTDNRKTVYFRVLAGPQINIITNVVYELNHTDIDLEGTNITPSDAYKRVTIDGVISPGVTFNLSKHFSLSADARFDYGFEDIENKGLTYSYMGSNTNYYGSGRAATHNCTIGFMAGVNYRL